MQILYLLYEINNYNLKFFLQERHYDSLDPSKRNSKYETKKSHSVPCKFFIDLSNDETQDNYRVS